jgi:ATP/maltotriose-dependent transcriptional regulator MalT
LAEIRTEELAFTEGEAASLLNDRLHLEVGADDLRVLVLAKARGCVSLKMASGPVT